MSNPSSPTPAPAPPLPGATSGSVSTGTVDTTPPTRTPTTSPGKHFITSRRNMYYIDVRSEEETENGVCMCLVTNIFQINCLLCKKLFAPPQSPKTKGITLGNNYNMDFKYIRSTTSIDGVIPAYLGFHAYECRRIKQWKRYSHSINEWIADWSPPIAVLVSICHCHTTQRHSIPNCRFTGLFTYNSIWLLLRYR